MNAFLFLITALKLFRTSQLNYEAKALEDGTIIFERFLPKLGLVIRAIGPERPGRTRGQFFVFEQLFVASTEESEPIVELTPTAIQVGWGSVLIRKLRTLERFLKEKCGKCECDGTFIPRTVFRTDKNDLHTVELHCSRCGKIIHPAVERESLTSELNKILKR